MNINIARFILAVVAATSLSLGARAEAPPWPRDTLQATDSDTGAPALAQSLGGNPFDALYSTPPGHDARITGSRDPIAQRSLLETGGGVTPEADGRSGNFAPMTGGVWLFLGGIWIIGTLVHHRQVIRKH